LFVQFPHYRQAARKVVKLACGVAARYQSDMSVIGKVTSGVIVLPPGISFPEGTEVRVELLVLQTEADPLVTAAKTVAKPRPDWPDDYVLNHGHYVSGEPRKS
jgi:hypothetical protein